MPFMNGIKAAQLRTGSNHLSRIKMPSLNKKNIMDTLHQKLNDWISVIQKSIIGVIVIQTILVIIIGIASNKVTYSFDIWFWVIFISSLFYIFLVIVMTAYQVKYPGSIVEELVSKKKLIEQTKLLDRQNAINQYITEAIEALNAQTCSINSSGGKNILCDQDLETRLNDLLETLVVYTDVILDTPSTKNFTIGLYLFEYYKLPNNMDEIELDENEGEVSIVDSKPIEGSGILVLKDDLVLRETLLPKNLIEIANAVNAQFEIQTSILRCYNNNHFDKHDFGHNDDSYSIVCSEIPQVCSDEYPIGVLFIISKSSITPNSSIKEILRIYNRLISNYTSKYNQCIIDHVFATKMKKAN